MNSSLKTPLMCAAELGWQDIFVLLVKAGAGMDAKVGEEVSCFLWVWCWSVVPNWMSVCIYIYVYTRVGELLLGF